MKETHPTAIMTHKCCECIKNIRPGDEYQCIETIEHNRWITYRTCADCEKKRNELGFEIAIGDLAFNLMFNFDYRSEMNFLMREDCGQTSRL